jgi:hypothetical protein
MYRRTTVITLEYTCDLLWALTCPARGSWGEARRPGWSRGAPRWSAESEGPATLLEPPSSRVRVCTTSPSLRSQLTLVFHIALHARTLVHSHCSDLRRAACQLTDWLILPRRRRRRHIHILTLYAVRCTLYAVRRARPTRQNVTRSVDVN